MTEKEEEFEITSDEMGRIKKALKDKQFRDLLVEYANEISDPVNKKKYEDEIIAMEKQRGQDVKLIKPQAGFVIKTCRLSDKMKVFLNVCTSPEVEEYTVTEGNNNGRPGSHVSLPHSLTPCREDVDKAGNPCVVYDVCFNPKAYDRALEDDRFRNLLIETSLDMLEKKGEIKVDRKHKKFPKMKYKGTPQASILRSSNQVKTANNNNMVNGETKPTVDTTLPFPYPDATKKTIAQNGNEATVPKYKVIHRGYFDMQNFTNSRENLSNIPKELVVEIQLPLSKSASGIDLDIFEKQLLLDSNNPSYHLDISLPYKIYEEDGQAQFDKAKKLLTVTLPVRKPDVVIQQEVTATTSFVQEIHNNCDDQTSIVCDKNAINSGHDVDSTTTNDIHDGHDVDSTIANVIDFSNIDMDNVQFDTTVLESLPGNYKLPPYCYNQTSDEITVVIEIPNVQIAHLSLGFTTQQVCFSFPQNIDDSLSPDWSMVIRLADDNYFSKDECGFDLLSDSFQLNLKKRHDSLGLWNRFFIGVSEVSLKAELFMTDNIAAKMVKEMKKPAALSQQDNSDVKVLTLEGRLQHLLAEQDSRSLDHNNYASEETDIILSALRKEDKDRVINDAICEPTKDDNDRDVNDTTTCSSAPSDSDELSLKVNLLDLQDDVIVDCSPLASPSNENPRKSRFTTRHVFERSMSESFNHHRSILKRSKSDGASCDTDDDMSYMRRRATTLSDDNMYPSKEKHFDRRRHKSVTFSEQPIVFEFTKLSKRQWKRQNREEKRKEIVDKKEKGAFKETTSNPDGKVSGEKEETKEEKHGKKWKKKDKRRQRNNSESRSEEETEFVNKKSRKKKRKNVKHNINNPESCSSGPDSSSTESRGMITPALSNSLIFELE